MPLIPLFLELAYSEQEGRVCLRKTILGSTTEAVRTYSSVLSLIPTGRMSCMIPEPSCLDTYHCKVEKGSLSLHPVSREYQLRNSLILNYIIQGCLINSWQGKWLNSEVSEIKLPNLGPSVSTGN